MAEAATIIVPALVTISVALSGVMRKLDLVALAHEDVAPFGPTGGVLPLLEQRATEQLENVEELKQKVGDPTAKCEEKIQELEAELQRLKAENADNEAQQEKIEVKIAGYKKYKAFSEKYDRFEKQISEEVLNTAEWYEETVVRRIWPRLGLFTFLHILNVFILWVTFVIIDAVVTDVQLYIVSKVLIALLWLLLPLLEVPEYGRIIADNEVYLSIPYYVIVTLATIMYLQSYTVHMLLGTIFLVFHLYYMWLLKSELENVTLE